MNGTIKKTFLGGYLMTKIIALASLMKDWQVEEVKQLATNYQVKLEKDLTPADYPNIEVLYGWNSELEEQFMANGYDSLRWIQVQFAGINQIPEEIVQNDQIQLTNMSGVHATPIAETVFGYLLNQYRSLHLYKEQEKTKTWQYGPHKSLPEKKMLIFGAGNVGKEIARIGQAFGMKTVGVNTSGKSVDHFDRTVKTAQGLSQETNADVIVNVLPATDATTNVFDLTYFKGQEKQPIFINVGRGTAVIDEDLITALDKGYISYAALDVFHEEPLPADHPFWAHEKVDVTPHMTGQVEHFALETYGVFKPNLDSYLQDGTFAINLVSKAKGY